MSQLRKLGSPVLEELAGQLRYAPAEAARRHVERAEKLAAIVEPGNVYPQDWIAQQLTGYRPERGGDGLVPGEQWLADLGPRVEMLCVRAAYTPAELAEPGSGQALLAFILEEEAIRRRHEGKGQT